MQHTASEPTIANSQQQPPLQRLDSKTLKSFDPLAVFSPPQPPRGLDQAAGSAGETPAAAVAAPAVSASSHVHAHAHTHTHSHPHTPVAPHAHLPLHTSVQIGADKISSVSSYSSSALSSGSFTAISVSPLPPTTPNSHTPWTPGMSPPQSSVSAPAQSPNSHAAISPAQREFFAGSPKSLQTSIAAATAPGAPSDMRVDVTSRAPVEGSAPSAHQQVASLHTASPSVHSPTIHPSPSSTLSSRSICGVAFSTVDTVIDPEGHVTSTRSHPDTSIKSADRTPSAVTIHDDGDSPAHALHSPGPPSASPGVPRPAIKRASLQNLPPVNIDSLNQASESEQIDSPLPPVVSALMAAQQAAGVTPGATLSMPHHEQHGRLLFIVGDASGAGQFSRLSRSLLRQHSFYSLLIFLSFLLLVQLQARPALRWASCTYC
jgi:hypothetical protein